MDRRRPLATRIRTTVHRARAWPIVLVAPFAVAGILAYAEALDRLGIVQDAKRLMLAVFCAAIVANLLLLACGAALLL